MPTFLITIPRPNMDKPMSSIHGTPLNGSKRFIKLSTCPTTGESRKSSHRLIEASKPSSSRRTETSSASIMSGLSAIGSLVVTKYPTSWTRSGTFWTVRCRSLTSSPPVAVPTSTITLAARRCTSQLLEEPAKTTPRPPCSNIPFTTLPVVSPRT